MPSFLVPIISLLGTVIGGTVGAFMMMEAAFVASSMLLLGGLALSYAQAKRAKRKARDAYNASQVDRLVNMASTVAPRELVMGRVRKGGTVFFKASTGSNKATFVMCIALAAHEIDAVEQLYFNDEAVTIDGSGNVTSAPYAITEPISITEPSTALTQTPIGEITYFDGSTWGAEGDGRLVVAPGPGVFASYQYNSTASNAKVRLVSGTDSQSADAQMLALFPALWTADHRARGVAYLVVELQYSETSFPTGLPTVTAVLRGAKIYDPRTTNTVWSDNPALMMRHVYQHPRFGKATVTAAEDARFVAAANACDAAQTYTVGGSPINTKLFRAGVVAQEGDSTKNLFDDLAQSMGGSWAFAGGELFVKAGVFTSSVMSLTEADIGCVRRTGDTQTQQPINIVAHRERAQKFNTVNVQIWDADQDYKQVTLTPLKGATLITRDGAELAQGITLAAVGFAAQALHVAGIMMRDARDPLTVVVPCKLRAYPIELFDTIDFTVDRYGWTNKLFQVIGREWNSEGFLQLTLKETAASIFAVDAAFVSQGYAINTALPPPWFVPVIGTLTVSSGTAELLKQSDGTIVSRMRVSWPAVDSQAVATGSIELQYRLVSSNGEWLSVVAPGGDTQAVIAGVLDGGAYNIRARCKTTLAVGVWNVQTMHQVVGKTAPPPPFDTFAVLVQPDGTRQYNFGYLPGTSPVDWLGAAIRYVPGADAAPDWDNMALLQDGQTYYTASPVELNAPLSGEYTFACKSIDTSGLYSDYLVRTLTLPDRRLGNVFDEFFEHVEGWLGAKTGCHVQDGYLEATDTTTWATLPATWTGWTRWNIAPTSPITYETPARDFGTVIAGQVNSTIDADGTVVQELATSADGISWSAWGSAVAAFATRYLKLRITVTATGPEPVPLVREWSYQINAPMRSEYINDIDISTLTGSYRIGVGDVRIPLAGVYSVIKRTTVVIQDSSAGTWAATRIDQSLSPSPRWQFRLNGTLADPTLVDFFIEGY